MKIEFVTGKGGVGKSAVAAALALKYSQSDQKALLVELGHESFFKDYLGLPDITYSPIKFRDNLDIAIWRGEECLREYAHHLLKLETLANLFLENPVTKSFIKVAPALSELAVLGKLTSQIRNVGPNLNYDVIIVDAPSTGHLRSLLRAPEGMAKAISVGPMHEQSKSILSAIRNPKITHFNIVTLPEELPIEESIELSKFLQEFTAHQPTIFINKYLSIPAEDKFKDSEFDQFLLLKNNQQISAANKMKELNNTKIFRLEYIFADNPRKIIEELSENFSLSGYSLDGDSLNSNVESNSANRKETT